MERFQFTAKVDKANSEIENVLNKIGITPKHPALAFFRTIYADLEKPNKNHVILAQSVEQDIPQLIGCQVNFSHVRYGSICGQILSAKCNEDNQIEVIFSFHKTVYEKEYESVIESYNKGELTVSFELFVNPKDIIQEGQYRKLKRCSFDGMGLLLSGETPACPSAIVFERAKKIIEDVFAQPDKELVYANIKDISKEWAKIGELLETHINKQSKELNLLFSKKYKLNEEAEFDLALNIYYNAEDDDVYLEAKKWSVKFINDLPNSSFAVIEPAYLKGETDDKRARHLPFKDKNGKVDLPHYRNALARVNQITPITDSISKEDLQKKAKATLDKYKKVLKKANEEEIKVDNTNNDKLLDEFKKKATAELGEDKVKDWTKEQWEAELKKRADEETKNSENAEENKTEKTEKPKSDSEKATDDKTAEKDKEDATVQKTKTTETRVYDVTEDSEKGTMEVVETITTQREVDGKQVKDEKVVRHTLYSQATLDKAKAEVKIEYEAKIKEKELDIAKKDQEMASKDDEIKKLNEKVNFYKENAKTVAEIRAELGDYAKELSDEDLFNEDKVKIARLTKQIEELKNEKKPIETASVKKEEDLETGHDQNDKQEIEYAKVKYMKSKVKK